MLKKFPLLLLLTSINVFSADCEIDTNIVAAEYLISQVTNADAIQSKYHIILWRDEDRVAHEFQNTDITNVWERTSNGKLRLTRNFDNHKRSIEYQPGEINYNNSDSQWETINQIISDEQIENMELVKSEDIGCNIIKSYTYNDDDKKIMLEWMPAKKLLKSYINQSNGNIVKWELLNVFDDESKIKQTFTSRDNYQSTDYADIGDNESDPFLLKMMNLGHIDHGASGFYNSDGHIMSGHEH